MTVIGPFEATVSEYDGEPLVLQFAGEEFKVDMDTGIMPLMEFAASAKSGLDSATMDGLAAMYSMIEDCLAPGEFDRFRSVAKQKKAKPQDIMQICTSIYAGLSNRPLDTEKSLPPGQSNPSTGATSDSDATRSSDLSTELASKKPANKRTRRAGQTS